ncbi:RTC4-like domain-containing protein, partial [Cristinia sonorae]
MLCSIATFVRVILFICLLCLTVLADFFDPRVDPSTLCPWCDEPLPKAPSPWLITLIASVRQKSISDPRPTNPQGVWASPTVYAHVCARHAFEDQHIPMAEAKGWPTRIQWSEVGNRIVAMKERLQAIIDDVDEEFIPGRQKVGEEANRTEADKPVADDWEDEELQQARPRKGSVFWRDVVKNVRQQGSKQASGVRGQFSSFEKTQPGYYGELGFVIISQTIYDLFPPHSLDSDSTLPLIPSEFLQLILIPEAAVGLIMEDMNQSRKASIKTLRESAEYGVAMFPDEGGTNVGEN